MSAVIWFGIVAVWAFVLIPTWVRRSDLHWRRSGDPSTTRNPLGRAARVISRSGSSAPPRKPAARTSTRTATVPRARRAPAPAAATARRPVAATAGAPTTTATATMTRTATPRTEAETASTAATASTASETAPSAQGPTAAEPEAPMTTPRSPRPVHRRTAPAGGRKATPPPHVQRARRLVWIAAAALATLLLALILGGKWVLVHLAADVALVAYLRHLRGIAVREREARRARRTSGARGEAPRETEREAPATRASAPAPRANRRIAEVRARVEGNRVSVPAAPAPDVTDEASIAASPAVTASAPTARSRMRPAPQVIDLTDGALADDCPTTELMAARAV